MAEFRGKMGALLVASAAVAAAAAQAGSTAILRASDCPVFTRHEPADDVTYRPERDREQGIVPADLAPGPDFSDRARNFDFAIWTDVRDRGGAHFPSRRAYAADGLIAVIEVRDGVPYLDDRPLSGDDAERLRALCLAAEGEAPPQKDR